LDGRRLSERIRSLDGSRLRGLIAKGIVSTFSSLEYICIGDEHGSILRGGNWKRPEERPKERHG
jgi:hypothetical protein